MSTFLGIGFGPIQTGIFLSGASKGGFGRIVVADVDESLIKSLRSNGGCFTLNIAARDRIYTETISGIEIYNPRLPADLEKLITAAAEADEVATALPSVSAFPHVIPWLKHGFERAPGKLRLVYTAENHNHAAELLEEGIGSVLPGTHFLNTVVGKMSGIVPLQDCASRDVVPLTPTSDRGHLVEEYNRILIGRCPGVDTRRTLGLHVKNDLLPFEEAKLYGHNAIHMLLGLHASEHNIGFMHELAAHPDCMDIGRRAFLNESGRALCAKWKGVDELFTEDGFLAYAEDLLIRMVNPYLRDAVDRICRDLPRKLGWDDRIIGAMRVAQSVGVDPVELTRGAAIAARRLFGRAKTIQRDGLASLWPTPWGAEQEALWSRIAQAQ